MRFATWNVQNGGAGVWRHLQKLRVDVALLQEANPPASFRGVHAPREYAIRDDGAALHIVTLASGAELSREPVRGRGSVLAARLGGSDGLRVLSVHAVLDKEQRESHDYQGFRRCIDGIEEYLAETNAPVLIGGDFNASLHLRYDVTAFAKQFRRLTALNLADLMCDDLCEACDDGCRTVHQSTRQTASGEWRIDYLFANAAARGLFGRAFVDMSAGMLSDHRPVIVDTLGDKYE
jgi:endonuclease/exonuclease/phosphatase family metal-dependent hydrolase